MPLILLWYINKNQRSGRKLLNWSCVFSSSLVIFLACTQTLFYFSFRSFRKHRRARERSGRGARSARKKNIERLFFSSPTTTSLRWRSINPLKKIEGLWTGYYIPDLPRNPGRRNTSSPKSACVGGCHDRIRLSSVAMFTLPNSCSRSHEKLFTIIWTATVWGGNKSFTHIKHRVGVVGRMGLVHLISVLSPEYLLRPHWVPVLAPIYFRERPVKWSCYI